MEQSKEQLQGEIRYAQRLCQRTARLYRRAQTTSTFFSIISGSAALISVSSQLPQWVMFGCAMTFSVFTAINLAVRPADKVAQNDVDVKKYSALLVKSEEMDVPALRQAIAEARQSDAPEVEPLRDVAFNDVMLEIGCEDSLVNLGRSQRLLSALA
ncbi:MAG: hypothetical protein V4754_16215 [Pseudomonadota bacterium]